MNKVKFAVIDLNDKDPVSSIWVKFDTEQAANDWVKNYLENASRKRNFGIKQMTEND